MMARIAEPAHHFDDGSGYERFMGCWSRAACPRFLDWIEAPGGLTWLDVGCGTGILAEEIIHTRHPEAVHAIDPSAAQIVHAKRAGRGAGAHFQVGDARRLPFRARSFDVVAAALVLNFVTEREIAVQEMARVAQPEGLVAAFVWDFAAERSPSGPMRAGLRAAGHEPPAIPGTAASRRRALQTLFTQAGLREVATTSFEVSVAFRDFDDFWEAQLPSYNPITGMLDALPAAERERCRAAVQTTVPRDREGRPCYAARANAVRGCPA
jgi:SAM-dependent methyltransferase